MKKLLIFSLTLLTFGIAKGQKADKNFSVKIVLTTATLRNGEFTTNIYQNGNALKIVYSFRDSLARAYYKDKEYLELSSSLKLNMEGRSKTIEIRNALSSLERKYSYYSKDSLLLDSRKAAPFFNLLERFFSASAEELENVEESRKRGILDGAYYSISIKNGNKVKDINVDSPDPKTHPLVYQLITDSVELYKREKQNNFFDKMNTLSY